MPPVTRRGGSLVLAPVGAGGGLRVRKLADKSGGEAVRLAERADSPAGSWPLAGVRIEGEIPQAPRLPTSFVARGVAEGWIVGEGHHPVMRPAGRADNPWAPTDAAPQPHVFHHYDMLVLRTVDGDVRYRVVHQPDKYADPGDDDTPVTDDAYASGQTRVDHFYVLELLEA
jgi:hypothetical protein